MIRKTIQDGDSFLFYACGGKISVGDIPRSQVIPFM